MPNVIEFNEFTCSANRVGGELTCWLCQKGVSARALFCHHCGTIQPVRDIDHFARLGIERRIDIDQELLDKQYETLKRTLDPTRFIIRGSGERGNAEKQMEALTQAYDTLREPLKRGRYWLTLHMREVDEAEAANPMISELLYEVEAAIAPTDCDRVAQKAGQSLQQGIIDLMQSLRDQHWQQANSILVELDGLESVLAAVRIRRKELSPENGNGENTSGVTEVNNNNQ
ncbi:MAG: hypothetical protein PHX43_09445 [Alphaproteobacteria bacterium]|nr:hypothetical protein [Alphaproteobacteria bacterium]